MTEEGLYTSASDPSNRKHAYDENSVIIPALKRLKKTEEEKKLVYLGVLFQGKENGVHWHAIDLSLPLQEQTQTFSPLFTLPNHLEGYGSAALDSKIYVFGGYSFDDDSNLNTALVYDTTNTAAGWKPLPDMTCSRYCPTVATAGGKIFVLGSFKDHYLKEGSVWKSHWAETYTPLTQKWTNSLSKLPSTASQSEPDYPPDVLALFADKGNMCFNIGGRILFLDVETLSWQEKDPLPPLLNLYCINGKHVVVDGVLYMLLKGLLCSYDLANCGDCFELVYGFDDTITYQHHRHSPYCEDAVGFLFHTGGEHFFLIWSDNLHSGETVVRDIHCFKFRILPSQEDHPYRCAVIDEHAVFKADGHFLHDALAMDYTNPHLPVAPSAIDGSGQFPVGLDAKEQYSNALLVSIENMQYPVTVDTLYMVFSAYGPVQKIAMFEKNGVTHALIQYPDAQTAYVAKETLQGHPIYDGNFCTLRLSYSPYTDLSVNGARSICYASPNLYMWNSQPSLLGQQPYPMPLYCGPQPMAHQCAQPMAGWGLYTTTMPQPPMAHQFAQPGAGWGVNAAVMPQPQPMAHQCAQPMAGWGLYTTAMPQPPMAHQFAQPGAGWGINAAVMPQPQPMAHQFPQFPNTAYTPLYSGPQQQPMAHQFAQPGAGWGINAAVMPQPQPMAHQVPR